jgi:hypothetical protein
MRPTAHRLTTLPVFSTRRMTCIGALPIRHAQVSRTSSRRFFTFAAHERRNLGGLFSHDDSLGRLVYAIELHLEPVATE